MDDYSTILDYLGDRRAEWPSLTEVIDLHIALLSAQNQVRVSVEVEKDAEKVQVWLDQGRPLRTLETREPVFRKWDVFEKLYFQICLISAHYLPDWAEGFEEIRALAVTNPDQMRALVADYLAEGHSGSAESIGLDGTLLDFVLNNTLHPFLRAQAAALEPWFDEGLWFRGYCPACGGQPDLAVFERGTGARSLLCSRCDTEWAFKRLACPFCGNEDPSQLSYYPTKDKRYRLDVCEVCKGYLKTLDCREDWSQVSLPAERVLTVGLDLAAASEGYHVR